LDDGEESTFGADEVTVVSDMDSFQGEAAEPAPQEDEPSDIPGELPEDVPQPDDVPEQDLPKSAEEEKMHPAVSRALEQKRSGALRGACETDLLMSFPRLEPVAVEMILKKVYAD
jgi:hypothetical protein